jgi:hypothetical protein
VSMNNDTSHYAYILMYIISVEPRPTMKVNIHNQYSDLKLTNRGYFINGAVMNNYPDWEVYTGNMTSADLKSSLATFEGVLTYELQNRYVKSTYIRIFVAWKSEGYKKFRLFVQLIECDKQLYWSTAKLKEYYQRYGNQLCKYTGLVKDTWSIDDDTILVTELNLDFTQRDGVLNITISEGIKDEHTKRPIWINPER